jgi:hypothetical protein
MKLRKFPREPHIFPIIVTSLDSTDNIMASSDMFVSVGEEEILYICDPTVCLPEKSKVTRGLARVG